jgi:undecaprenyl-phosphate galactose phosphotransferase
MCSVIKNKNDYLPQNIVNIIHNYIEKNVNLILPLILILVDWVGVICAGRVAFNLRNFIIGNSILHISWLNSYVTFPFIFVVFFHIADLYHKRLQFWIILEKIFYSCIYATVTVVVLLYVTHIASTTSRLYVFLLFILSFLFVMVFRYSIKNIFNMIGILKLPILLIGGGKTAGLVLNAIRKDAISLGYNVIGVLDDDGAKREEIGTLPYLGSFIDAEKVIKKTGVKDVLITAPGLNTEALNKLIYRIQPLVRNLSFVPDLIGLPVANIEVESMFDEKLMILSMRNNLARRFNRVIKLLFDYALTVVGTFLISPILVLLAILIRIDSKGPIFFAHSRIGIYGKIFPCYKFRTMCVNAEEKLHEYLAANPAAREEWDKEFKLKDDPRVTRIGKILRKTSLDELPQIFNVLKGEMSLVGPRPIVTKEIPKYGDFINDYYMVRPGITGMWQVNGRSDTTYDERVRMDSWYVRNWSVWLDAALLSKTFSAVVKGKGAY